jgi:hypothetical protein
VNGTAIELNVRVFPGSGTPNGGAAFTDAHLLTDGPAIFEDQAGTLYDGVPAITSWRNTTDGIPYPIRRRMYKADIYGDTAMWFDAVGARRLSVETLRYAEPAALTPVGANQAITVTGYTRVTVTPVAAATIDRATFNATPGSGAPTDYGRNGDLIIEAGNANLTIVDGYGGADGFRTKDGNDIVMAAGEIRRFMRSANYLAGVGGWVEV